MMLILRMRRASITQVVFVIVTAQTVLACSEGPSGTVCDKLPLSRDPMTGPRARRAPTSAQWKGREYDVESGIAVLMDAVRSPEKDTNERQLALLELAALQRGLEGRACIDELAKLYESAGDSERGAILLCFMASEDPRAIPVFMRALDNEKSMKLRLRAAGALAHWNIRRGVAELVALVDSNEILEQPVQMPYVRDNAMRSFRLRNIRKGWGFPDDKESAEWPPDVAPPPDVAARWKPRPTVEEIKKWFAENEGRFPDWKLGDPLPEVTPTEEKKSNDEKP